MTKLTYFYASVSLVYEKSNTRILTWQSTLGQNRPEPTRQNRTEPQPYLKDIFSAAFVPSDRLFMLSVTHCPQFMHAVRDAACTWHTGSGCCIDSCRKLSSQQQVAFEIYSIIRIIHLPETCMPLSKLGNI